MAFEDNNYLAGIVQTVLDGVAAALTDAGRPPDRAVRTDGPPALDCPGLFAYATTALVDPGVDQDTRPMRRQVRIGAFIAVTLARCQSAVPDDRTGVPSPEAVDADGVGYHTDLWITQRALITRLRDGSLVAGGACTVAHLNPVTPLPPSGGLYGLTTTIDVALG